ncbi:hypothetical protein K7432_008078 [Basidiobolus ranarum]|uniref:Proteasome assembly chaperone 2 n=1 Tax=Basidiobolus ranarum TaxID=34480 RepID=A0ABR2VZ62_9FUNG
MQNTVTFNLNYEGEIPLYSKVVLGFPDNCIAGTRLLNSIEDPTASFSLDFDGFDKEQPIITNLDTQGRLVVKNFDHLETSVVIVNVLPSDKKLLGLADALVSLISKSTVQTLYILGTFDFTASKEELHTACLNSEIQLDYPKLNTSAPLNNIFLNTLITLLRMENLPTQFLLYPSKKFKVNSKDDIQMLTYFSEQLKQSFGFSIARSKLDSLELRTDEDDRSSMMYL